MYVRMFVDCDVVMVRIIDSYYDSLWKLFWEIEFIMSIIVDEDGWKWFIDEEVKEL